MTVFSISLKYIRDHLFKSLSDKFSEIQKEDIHYVLTVPAIWDDNAKQFMREAAVKVSSQQLEALVLKSTRLQLIHIFYMPQSWTRYICCWYQKTFSHKMDRDFFFIVIKSSLAKITIMVCNYVTKCFNFRKSLNFRISTLSLIHSLRNLWFVFQNYSQDGWREIFCLIFMWLNVQFTTEQDQLYTSSTTSLSYSTWTLFLQQSPYDRLHFVRLVSWTRSR